MEKEYESFVENKKIQRKPSFKLFKNMRPGDLLLLTALAIVSVFIYYKDPENLKFIVIIGVIAIVIYLFSIMSKGQESKIIPLEIAIPLTLERLKENIGRGGFFVQGTSINPTGFCFLRKVGDLEVFTHKWWLGFKIKSPGKPEKDIVVKLNPYTGDIIGISNMPTGFEGNEIKDVLYIYPETMQQETKPKT